MKPELNLIPDRTLEAFARGFFNEASLYGFQRTDYVRFVNHLLDITIAMKNGRNNLLSSPEMFSHMRFGLKSPDISCASQLPIVGEKVTIRALNIEDDLELMKHWFKDDSGKNFLLSCSEPVMPDYEEFLTKPQN